MRRKREKRRSARASDSPEAATHTELAPLSERFRQFADEARTYAGPLYTALSRQIAEDEELLGVARHVRRPPVPNVFLAAVHFLLAESPEHELSAFYASLCDDPRPPAEAYPAFRDFVLSNTARLIPLLDTRITQTNEVGRCSFLLPAFTAVHQSAPGRPLALSMSAAALGCISGGIATTTTTVWRKSGDPRAAVSHPLRAARPRHAAAAGELSRVPLQGRDRSQPRRPARSD